MHCVLAVLYFLLSVLLIVVTRLEGFQFWILLFPFAEACLSATMMQYDHVTMKVKIKAWRKIILEALRWSFFVILLYRWLNVYSIVIITSEIWIWCTIEMLQPKISERITYI
jgi:hypothetical protein